MLVVETIANSSGVFFAKDDDQVDLPRFACFAKSGSEGPPVAGDRVPLSARCPGPEFWGEVQPPGSLKGLDIPFRRAVFVPWKPSRRPAFGMGNPTFR